MFQRRRNSSMNGMFVGALLGGVVGAASALLFAPERGEVTRKNMIKQLDGLRQGKVTATMMEIGNEWSDDLAQTLKGQKGRHSRRPRENQEDNQIGEMIREVVENELPPTE
ncbi:YtxH domain-containing protein [Halalkalibacterium halodurans]|jgi:gas vesicle protein|uniref:YtxH domain-containing protein n=1 Tax=Halalkalibacterium halodurans TaxID=86665 RepID=UPI0010686AAB|nr:YtxH domain-containing protein [Halalkalibacterium halodurans]TES55848.1 YtxH domain-containing protein [Halalkalibacterium halodurans]